MTKRFSYRGNATVGSYVARCLEEAGYEQEEQLGDADVVVTYCTTQSELEDTYFDDGGIVQMANPGAMLIDLSASTPTFARELNAVAVVNDLGIVESPLVVVNPALPDAFVDPSNIVCFIAGEEDSVKAALPVVRLLAGDVQDIGGAGSAQLARAAYSLQNVAQIVSAIEADALYHAVRRDAAAVGGPDSPRAGATTPQAENVLAAVAAGRFDGNYTVEMLMGEITAALTAADDADLILPQAEAAQRLLELLAIIGGMDMAPAAVALTYRDEETAAAAGLDWSRAEQAYGHSHSDDDDDDDDYDDEDGHDHGGFSSYYSAN